MDKNKKIILSILNYLSKKFKGKDLSFEDYSYTLKKLNFIDQADNRELYKFFVENNKEGVNWEQLNLAPFINTLINKITMIANGDKKANEVFTDPIDDFFELGGGENYIDFYGDHLQFNFREPDSQFLLNLINLEEHDLGNYYAARYNGNCYRPDYEDDDILHIFQMLSSENLSLLSDIAKFLGENKLSIDIKNHSQNNTRLRDSESVKIINLIEKFFKSDVLSDIHHEYANHVESASCDSIIEAFREHFPDGVDFIDSQSLRVNYDFLIDFLKENPSIKTFSDLRDVNLIDDYSDLGDAYANYDLDTYALNRDIYYIFNRLHDKVLSDEENISEKVEAFKEFEDMIRALKFRYGADYVLQVVDKDNNLKYKFEIDPDDVDYDNRKLKLTVKDYRKGGEMTKHRIPFEDLPKYVTIEKLYESILSKLL